jgi:putative ABC transport system substrate-binding protein
MRPRQVGSSKVLKMVAMLRDNVAVEYRWAEGKNERLPALAAELVARKVAVMVVNTAALLPAIKATKTIPIVFVSSVDPVKLGAVASLSRPGGNVTGVTSLNVDLGSKRLELLHELMPAAGNCAFLVHSANPNSETLLKDAHAAASRLGMQITVLRVDGLSEVIQLSDGKRTWRGRYRKSQSVAAFIGLTGSRHS